MSAWRNWAALGLVLSVGVAGCTFSSDDDEDDDNGGSSGRAGSAGSAGKAGAAGSGGTAAGGASGGAGASGSGGSGGSVEPATCNPNDPNATDCQKCLEGAAPKCCESVLACAGDEFCSPSGTSAKTQCTEACIAASCAAEKTTAECTDAEITAYDAAKKAECTSWCSASTKAGEERAEPSGEYECTLRCVQGVYLNEEVLTEDELQRCGGGCKLDSTSGTPAEATMDLVTCTREQCAAECIGVAP